MACFLFGANQTSLSRAGEESSSLPPPPLATRLMPSKSLKQSRKSCPGTLQNLFNTLKHGNLNFELKCADVFPVDYPTRGKNCRPAKVLINFGKTNA